MARGEVWVWGEQRGGRLANVSLELLGQGRELAEKLGVGLSSVLVGDGVEGLAWELVYHGADKVYLLDDPRFRLYEGNLFAELLARLAEMHRPQILLLGATSLGRELSAAVAAKLGTGLTAHCIELYLNEESRMIQVVPWLEENAMVEIICSRNPQMATAKPGVFPQPERDEQRKGEMARVVLGVAEEPKAKTLEMFEEEPSGQVLETADIVVAGGFGLHSGGGFELIEELARVLGGAVGGTRPAVDRGWIPEKSMIGQSGKTVSPKLFISIGASGAMHFTTGFLRSKVIFALDQNPKAPIFEVADVGIVGDVKEILPHLIEELKRARSTGPEG